MAQEVTIAGATYSNVPSISVPDSSNVFHPFVDPSVTTATASDVASGKVFIASDGTQTTGTASGGVTANEVARGQGLTNVVITESTIRDYAFYDYDSIVSVVADNVTSLAKSSTVESSVFRYCSNLESIHMASLTSIGNTRYVFANNPKLTSVYLPSITDTGDYAFFNDTGLVTVVLPSSSGGYRSFYGCTKLLAVDYGGETASKVSTQNFFNCTKMVTLILRSSSVTPLTNINAFQNSPFASGKAGGTLYVPSSLISSYRSATNWSTILGYSTNSIVAIEGSQYENYYADGTSVS